MTSQDGSGHKAVLENGSDYWLLDEYPDQLSLFLYDEDGRVYGQMTKAGSHLSAVRFFLCKSPDKRRSPGDHVQELPCYD